MNEYKTVSPKDALASSALNASYQRVKILEHFDGAQGPSHGRRSLEKEDENG